MSIKKLVDHAAQAHRARQESKVEEVVSVTSTRKGINLYASIR